VGPAPETEVSLSEFGAYSGSFRVPPAGAVGLVLIFA